MIVIRQEKKKEKALLLLCQAKPIYLFIYLSDILAGMRLSSIFFQIEAHIWFSPSCATISSDFAVNCV